MQQVAAIRTYSTALALPASRKVLLVIIVLGATLTFTPVVAADAGSYTERQEIAAELVHHPESPLAHSRAGKILFEYGEFAQAAAHYELAINADRHSATLRKNLAALYLVLQRKDDAEKQLAAVLTLTPDEVQAYLDLGEIYLANGKASFAEQVYRQAITRIPGEAVLHSRLALSLGKPFKYKEAIPELEEVIRLSPRNGAAYNNLGAAYEESGDYEQALRAYEHAAELSPGEQVIAGNVRRLRQGKTEFEKNQVMSYQ